jgi:hypothetical protein
MDIMIGAGIGLLAGLHTATWGMYKDAPHEGFGWRRYSRSVWLGGTIGAGLGLAGLAPWGAGAAVVFFGLVYALERAGVEFYKTFVRVEDQSKYFIPMQFHVLGRVVHGRAKRLVIGAIFVAVALGLLAAVAQLRDARPPILVVALVGSLGGWFSAFAGAWKDAPIEGFETLKFFRSPVLAGTYAALLWRLSGDPVVVALAATGLTIATLETYKTFFFPGRPRGKFAGKPVLYPGMLSRRNVAVPLYVSIWAALIGAAALGLFGG